MIVSGLARVPPEQYSSPDFIDGATVIKIPFKRGDTFLLQAVYKRQGVPVNISAIDIRSQVRIGTKLVADLTVSKTNAAAGEYSLTATATEAWPVELLECDVEYTEGGVKTSSPTFQIEVSKDVTLPV